jgi:hypothetical protein
MNETQQNQNKNQLNFKMHPNILKHIIMEQAGTLEKSFLELVMNGVDAGATKIEITLKEDYFEVKDNGKGFSNEEEILEYFQTFGTPHEEGDAEFGKFRMGRGQIMPFAKTKWRSNTFSMETDLNNPNQEIGNELGFEFIKNLDFVDGCSVSGTFYNENGMELNKVNKMIYTIPKFIQYMKTDVYLNGKKININLDEVNWTFETPEAYFFLDKDLRELDLYNKGAFVYSKDSYYYNGFGGKIISKNKLNINFARNEVLMYECQEWYKINNSLTEYVNSQRKTSKSLNFSEKKYLVNDFKYGTVDIEKFLDYKIFKLINGKNYSLKEIIRNNSFLKIEVNHNKENFHQEKEYIMKTKVGVIFDKEILELFEVADIKDFISILEYSTPKNDFAEHIMYYLDRIMYYLENVSYINYSTYSSLLKDDYSEVKNKDLKDKERIILNIIKKKNQNISLLASSITNTKIKERKIFVGSSCHAQAWTNGESVIYIERNLLLQADKGISGFNNIYNVMLHEYLHHDNSSDQHSHGLEFYENFHNGILQENKNFSIIKWSKSSTELYLEKLQEKNIKPRKVLLEESSSKIQKNEEIFFKNYMYFHESNVLYNNKESLNHSEYLKSNVNESKVSSYMVNNDYYQKPLKYILMIEEKILKDLGEKPDFFEELSLKELRTFINYIAANNLFHEIYLSAIKNEKKMETLINTFFKDMKYEPMEEFFMEKALELKIEWHKNLKYNITKMIFLKHNTTLYEYLKKENLTPTEMEKLIKENMELVRNSNNILCSKLITKEVITSYPTILKKVLLNYLKEKKSNAIYIKIF